MSHRLPTDFDFLIGEWNIQNKRLLDPLAGSTEWTEFPARLVDHLTLLGGLANIDQFKAELDGEPFVGSSLRVFDPSTGEWTIYWMDTKRPVLTEQVIGTFEDGIGTFYGEERYKGTVKKLRFLWDHITTRSARWEQAYYT